MNGIRKIMNKIRIIGLLLLVIGIALFILKNTDVMGMAAGLLSGIGIGLLITGRIKFKSNK